MQPRIAIAVQKYFHSGQTFVNRHLAHLFSGNSCVISERNYQNPPEHSQKSAFVFTDHIFNRHDLIRLPYHAAQNWFNHHSLRIPYGEHRKALKTYLRNENVNVILSEFGSQAMLVSDLGKEMDIPVFCYFRGRDASYWLHNKKRILAYKTLFPNLAGIFAVSQFLLDNLASKGLIHENAHVIPSGTDTEHFKPAKKDPNLFLAVGRFVGKKAPNITIQAFLAATKNRPNARLEMIGGGPLLPKARALVDSLHAHEKVILHDKQPSAFIAERLSRTSVFLQHSVIDKTGEAEGLPSSIQEAMAAGCAIASTRHAGIPELVNNSETGYLSNEYDEVGFKNAIIRCIENPEKLSMMQKNARQLAEKRIDFRKLYAQVEEIISNTLS